MAGSISRRLALQLTAAGVVLAGRANAAAPTAAGLPDDMAMGDPKAKVTVVEYASASCPHCAHFNNEVFPDFRKKYVDTGKVLYVFREFLTQPVEIAAAGFLLARCAGPSKYFSVLDDFFRGQEEMYRTGDARALIQGVGTKAGLTQAQIEACFDDEAAAKALNDRVMRNAAKDGVNSTPTFVINGKKLDGLDHEVRLADLEGAIAPLLKARRR